MATNTAINRSCDNFRLSQTALVVAGYPLAEDPKTRPPIRSVVWEIVDSELNVVGQMIALAVYTPTRLLKDSQVLNLELFMYLMNHLEQRLSVR